MFKIVKEEASNYLLNLIPKIQQTTRTKINRMPTFTVAQTVSRILFPSTKNDWNKLDETIKKLWVIPSLESNIYNIFDPIGLKFLTRLHLGFGHLKEHRFRHNVQH